MTEKPFVNAAFAAIEERCLKGFERSAFKKMGIPFPGDSVDLEKEEAIDNFLQSEVEECNSNSNLSFPGGGGAI